MVTNLSFEEFTQEVALQKKNQQRKKKFLKLFQREAEGEYFSFVENKFALKEKVFHIVSDYNEKTKYAPFELDTDAVVCVMRQRNSDKENLYIEITIKDNKHKLIEILMFPIRELSDEQIAEQLISKIDMFVIDFVKHAIKETIFYSSIDYIELVANELKRNNITLIPDSVSLHKVGYSFEKNTITFSIYFYSTVYPLSHDYLAVVNYESLNNKDFIISYSSTSALATQTKPLSQVSPSNVTVVRVDNITLEEISSLAIDLFKPVHKENRSNRYTPMEGIEYEQVSLLNELSTVTKNYPITTNETVTRENKNGFAHVMVYVTILDKYDIAFLIEEVGGTYRGQFSISESSVKIYTEKINLKDISVATIVKEFDLAMEKATWYSKNM